MNALFSQITTEPFRRLWHLSSLPPDALAPALALLAAFMITCELVRVTLATELVRSVAAHVTICLFTFVAQSLVLAFVLVHAAIRHPERAWLNLLFALGLYVLWFAIGRLTRLVRPGTEGADLGFMTVGALITFPVGLVAALAT